MRALIAFLILSSVASADDFRWSVESPFSWSVTEKGGGPESQPDTAREDAGLPSPHDAASPGTDARLDNNGIGVDWSDWRSVEWPDGFWDAVRGAAPVADMPVSAYVHRISTHRNGRRINGSGVHIGGGVYVTCAHGYDTSPGWQLLIDGSPVSGRIQMAPAHDVAIVQSGDAVPEAAVKYLPLVTTGEEVTAFGMATGEHRGTVTETRWLSGKRSVILDGPTSDGDSGGGVFNQRGELIGILNSRSGNEAWFTPLSDVAALVASFTPAAAPPAAPGADTSPVGGRRSSVAADDDSPGADSQGGGFDVSKRADGRLWWHDGTRWHVTSSTPQDGMTFYGPHGAFIYRHGQMFAGESQSPSSPQQGGYWKVQCFGDHCERVWVPN